MNYDVNQPTVVYENHVLQALEIKSIDRIKLINREPHIKIEAIAIKAFDSDLHILKNTLIEIINLPVIVPSNHENPKEYWHAHVHNAFKSAIDIFPQYEQAITQYLIIDFDQINLQDVYLHNSSENISIEKYDDNYEILFIERIKNQFKGRDHTCAIFQSLKASHVLPDEFDANAMTVFIGDNYGWSKEQVRKSLTNYAYAKGLSLQSLYDANETFKNCLNLITNEISLREKKNQKDFVIKKNI